jgi:hypothetical protein
MTQEKLIQGALTIVIFGCAIISIFHLPGAEIAKPIILLAFIGQSMFLSLQNKKLKKRITELENQI